MQELNLFKIFTERLNTLSVPYIVTNSVASIIYGEPGITHDVDIVITIPLNSIERFKKLFPSEDFYFPPIDILKTEIYGLIEGTVILFTIKQVSRRIFISQVITDSKIGLYKMQKLSTSIIQNFQLPHLSMLLLTN